MMILMITMIIMIVIMVMMMMMMMMIMKTIIANKEKAAVLWGLVAQVCPGISQVEIDGKLTAFNRLIRGNFS